MSWIFGNISCEEGVFIHFMVVVAPFHKVVTNVKSPTDTRLTINVKSPTETRLTISNLLQKQCWQSQIFYRNNASNLNSSTETMLANLNSSTETSNIIQIQG